MDAFSLGSIDLAGLHLVAELMMARVAEPQALQVIAEVWRDFTPAPDTHVHAVQQLTRRTLAELDGKGLLGQCDSIYLRREWSFPLCALELNEDRVSVKDLAAVRDQWVADGGWAHGGW